MSGTKDKNSMEAEISSLLTALRKAKEDRRNYILKIFLRGLKNYSEFLAYHPKSMIEGKKGDQEKEKDAEKFETFLRLQGGEELDYESLMISLPPLSASYSLKKSVGSEETPNFFEGPARLFCHLMEKFPVLSSSSSILVTFHQLMADYIANPPTADDTIYCLETAKGYRKDIIIKREDIKGDKNDRFLNLYLSLQQEKIQKQLDKEMTLFAILSNPWNKTEDEGIITAKTLGKLFSNYSVCELYDCSRQGLESQKRFENIKANVLEAMAKVKSKDLIREMGLMLLQLGLARGSIEDILSVFEICEKQQVEIPCLNIIQKLASWIRLRGIEDIPVGKYKKISGSPNFKHCCYAAANGNFYYNNEGQWQEFPSSKEIHKGYDKSMAFCLQDKCYCYCDVNYVNIFRKKSDRFQTVK